MTHSLLSVAMTGTTEAALHGHLLREDKQEDLCLASYAPSSGVTRSSALLRDLILPQPGERTVHGNASFTGDYVLRAASVAARDGLGIALLHSHPRGKGWQGLSRADADAESSYAHVAQAVTGHPLVGLTLAGADMSWSARRWDEDQAIEAESIRVIDTRLRVCWNDKLRPPPQPEDSQVRTISAWCEQVQADLARLRVLVVGVGSVGLDVALRLAATGIQHVGVMDFDTLETINLDRIVSATSLDVMLHRSKAEFALRQLHKAATARTPHLRPYEHSICEPDGLNVALDYDVIFSCVDRPWPRAVLNQVAYSDLIPVIDGGIAIDPFRDGGMRNATWRSHVIRPARPCLVCNEQLDLTAVPLDRDGLLDDPEYIKSAGLQQPSRQNVAALSISVAASQLVQFISLVVAPGGLGEPGPMRYVLSTHTLDKLSHVSRPHCAFEQALGRGDDRVTLTGRHERAEQTRAARRLQARRPMIRIIRAADDLVRH